MKISLKRISLLVGTGTFLSKLIAMVRKIVIAAYFGVSPAYDAFTYAYLIPNFFFIFIGGFNGPFHNAMVSTLSNKNNEESERVFSNINTLIGTFFLIISFLLFFYADYLIKVIAPGLEDEIKYIATSQLKIMSPIVFISGLIGFSMGLLNSKGKFFSTSITSLASNLIIVFLLIFLLFKNNFENNDYASNYSNGLFLASFTLIGALATFLIQLFFLRKKGLLNFRLNWELNPKIINEIIRLFIPASITSSMSLLNIMIDRVFVSGFIGASASITYAAALVLTPIGIISNALVVPSLPSFSLLYKNKNYELLVNKIIKILVYALFSMLCIASIFMTSNGEIVELVYGRGIFDAKTIFLVSNIFFVFALGMPFYILRDILIRIFIGFSDAKTPFLISLNGLIINVLLDWVVIGSPIPKGNLLNSNYGAEGVIFATIIVDLLSSIALIISLSKKIVIFPLKSLFYKFSKLFVSFFIAIILIMILNSIIETSHNIIGLLFQIIIVSLTSIISFSISAHFLNINESKEIINLLKKKFI